MLELRPNCEWCDRDLPPDATDAMICSYECTFCADCVDKVLDNVCPNCGGGFERRPIRPATARRDGVSLTHHPANTARRHSKYIRDQVRAFSKTIRDIPPAAR